MRREKIGIELKYYLAVTNSASKDIFLEAFFFLFQSAPFNVKEKSVDVMEKNGVEEYEHLYGKRNTILCKMIP